MKLERIAGFSLGTADLLGQMAAADYVDKLPILYSEFAEAARYNDGKMKAGGFFTSAEDLMQKTPAVLGKLRPDKKSTASSSASIDSSTSPIPDGPNPYLERIEANMARLRRQLASAGKPA